MGLGLRNKGMFWALRRLPATARQTVQAAAITEMNKHCCKAKEGALALAAAIEKKDYSSDSVRRALKLKEFVKENGTFVGKEMAKECREKAEALAEAVIEKAADQADIDFLKKGFSAFLAEAQKEAMLRLMKKIGAE